MKLSQLKKHLLNLDKIEFALQDGSVVPSHFHVTEVGKIVKHFMDCGGTERLETVVNFQLWQATDFDHRLNPQKLHDIIELSEKRLGLPDVEIEVEYQSSTIGKYGLSFNGTHFILTSTQTDCLALESCGVPVSKPRVKMSDLQNSCAPGSGCC